MFNLPVKADPTVEEGTVVQVDAARSYCKVRTLKGQVLQAVVWLSPFGGSSRGGDRGTPCMGDRVLLNHGLGYPVIVGFLPRIQTFDGATPLSIGSGASSVDTGNYSPGAGAVKPDQNRPKDFIQGDRVISSEGGAMMALMRGGGLLLRSSRASEMLLSNLHSLARIVSRNWEHFTDLSSDVIKNFKGRVYRYTGYAKTFAESKIEDYKLHFYAGDVAAAEAIKTGYNSYTGTPTTNNVIYKEQITDSSGEIMRRTLELNGNEEVWIKLGSQFTRINSKGDQLKLSWNDQTSITIDSTKIEAHHKDGANVIMDQNGIRATYQNGEVSLNPSTTKLMQGSRAVTLTSSKVSIT